MKNLFFFSLSITFFFLILLISKKGKANYDRMLIIWFSIIFLQVATFYLEFFEQFIYLLEIGSALVFLSGPILWLYSLMLVNQSYKPSRGYFVHLLPFALNILFIIPFVVQGTLVPLSDFTRTLITIGKLASIIFYCLAILKNLNRHKAIARQNLSNLESTHLKWLRFVVYGILLIWVIGFISEVFLWSNINSIIIWHGDLIVNSAVSILIITIGYYGFIQAPVFVKNEAKLNFNKDKNYLDIGLPRNDKYGKSGLTSIQILEYSKALEDYMVGEKPFKDPNLSLGQLAKKLNLSANQLSQVINTHFDRSFYEYVNRYRVEEVMKLMKYGSIDQLTILGIALDAGFNSKATFNRYFKKYTGRTPTDYLKNSKQTR